MNEPLTPEQERAKIETEKREAADKQERKDRDYRALMDANDRREYKRLWEKNKGRKPEL